MAVFPRLTPEFLTDADRTIRDRMETFYMESITANQSFWAEADVDTRFEAGDQTIWNDIYGNIPATRRKQFNFNRIRRVVNMISGHQRRTRKSTIVVPVENGDSTTADQFTKVQMWVNQRDNISETISEAFHGALVTGMNLLQVWVDYRNDPISGNIRVDNCSYNSFLIDPFFKKADLSDCNGLWKRSFLSKQECASLIPEYSDEIMALTVRNTQDGKFQYMPENYDWGQRNLLTYDEFYYRDYRRQRMLVDTVTGETTEWRSTDEDKLKEFLALYPQVTVITQDIPTVKLAIVVQGKVFYDGQNPLGIDSYPFIPVFGYYNPQLSYFPWRLQGVVRGLRDAQFLYNRRKCIELDLLESQINSGWKYKENALVDPRDVFLSGQGRGLAIKEEASLADVEQILPPQIPPSMFALSEQLGREIQEISGVNDELLGSASDDKAGILSMLRQGAGLTTLQTLFDQLDRSQKLLGRIILDVIQNNFTPGKVKRIIEEEPTPEFYNKTFGKYDAVIEEGFNTSTQRQMNFAQLLQLRELGIPIPNESLLDAATIQNKTKLIEQIAAAEQAQQQLQEQQQQLAAQEQAASIRLANARATADEGLGVERYSRIAENQTMADERKTESLLNLVKALKELEDMDITQIQRLVSLSKELQSASESPDPDAVVRGMTLQQE